MVSERLGWFRDHCRAMAESEPTTKIKAAWAGGSRVFVAPVGQMADEERDLWRRLADEIDEFAERTEDVALWSE